MRGASVVHYPDILRREDVEHFRGRGRGGEVDVAGPPPHQQISHGAAGDPQLVIVTPEDRREKIEFGSEERAEIRVRDIDKSRGGGRR